MTHTDCASGIRVGDQIRADIGSSEWTAVIERKAFRKGTRIHLRLADGSERTMVSATSIVVKREAL